jgi:hypothetical protein
MCAPVFICDGHLRAPIFLCIQHLRAPQHSTELRPPSTHPFSSASGICARPSARFSVWKQSRLPRTRLSPEARRKASAQRLSTRERPPSVRNRTLTLIEREDDTSSWRNFLVYFSHSTTMPYPPRGWGYILIGC